MTDTDPCTCDFHAGIPAVVAVCGYHARTMTHTPAEGYTVECPKCDGVGGTEREGVEQECKPCIGTGRAPVTLVAAKAARKWLAEVLPRYERTPLANVFAGNVKPRRRPR